MKEFKKLYTGFQAPEKAPGLAGGGKNLKWGVARWGL